ncbi:hypothetical protein PEC301937_04410 [Pectobacterium carotovorum subsp. carotovorum]|nr:hypothetical protein PEC301937_04410 [Pectobacterium carotovorum subsp. carotovorum]GLW40193.1 hypothetical protein Pcaca04_41290 [Pectobacterium carotovorum subsp. carotovorum]
MALTDIKVRSAKAEEKEYSLTDGDGMFLLVHPNSSKYWRLRFRFGGKQHISALGVYPEVSLSEARQKRDKARKHVAAGIDPREHKKAVKAKQEEDEKTFEVVVLAWHADKKKWSESHGERILKSLSDTPYRHIGNCGLKFLDRRHTQHELKRDILRQCSQNQWDSNLQLLSECYLKPPYQRK